MTAPRICAAPDCENTIAPSGRPGRPTIYCSAICRPSALSRKCSSLVVELDHVPTPDDTRPAGRVWLVRLRHGTKSVVIAEELGRPSADHLVRELNELIGPRSRAERGGIE